MAQAQCLSCYREYDMEASDASVIYMFCSKDCEETENTRLAEQNKLYEEALKRNASIPKQLEQTTVPQSFRSLLNFTKKEDENGESEE